MLTDTPIENFAKDAPNPSISPDIAFGILFSWHRWDFDLECLLAN